MWEEENLQNAKRLRLKPEAYWQEYGILGGAV